jgi:hypothetical protein
VSLSRLPDGWHVVECPRLGVGMCPTGAACQRKLGIEEGAGSGNGSLPRASDTPLKAVGVALGARPLGETTKAVAATTSGQQGVSQKRAASPVSFAGYPAGLRPRAGTDPCHRSGPSVNLTDTVFWNSSGQSFQHLRHPRPADAQVTCESRPVSNLPESRREW